MNACASHTSSAVGYPLSQPGSWGAGGCSCSAIAWMERPEQGSLGQCGSTQEVMLSPFCASFQVCHPGDLCVDPIFICFFIPLSLSLLLSLLSSLPLPSVCGLITAQTFNSDGNWNNNTGRILLAPLLQLASESYE